MELARNQVALVRNLSILSEKQEEIGVLKMMADNVSSPSLKETLANLIDNFESDEGISALTQQCGEIKGVVDAQKRYPTGDERRKVRQVHLLCLYGPVN